jgi:hypothetical protein
MDNDSPLAVLYDHYKDTFTHYLYYQRQRNRLSLYIIGLLALVLMQLNNQLFFTKLADGIILKLCGSTGTTQNCPTFQFQFYLTALWGVLLATVTTYYQRVTTVDRTMDYLHDLEKLLIRELNGKPFIRREGYDYKHDQPLFQIYTRTLFQLVLPVVIVVIISYQWYGELDQRALSPKFFWTDTVLALLTCITPVLFLFHNLPTLFKKILETIKKTMSGTC